MIHPLPWYFIAAAVRMFRSEVHLHKSLLHWNHFQPLAVHCIVLQMHKCAQTNTQIWTKKLTITLYRWGHALLQYFVAVVLKWSDQKCTSTNSCSCSPPTSALKPFLSHLQRNNLWLIWYEMTAHETCKKIYLHVNWATVYTLDFDDTCT